MRYQMNLSGLPSNKTRRIRLRAPDNSGAFTGGKSPPVFYVPGDRLRARSMREQNLAQGTVTLMNKPGGMSAQSAATRITGFRLRRRERRLKKGL